MMDEKFSDEQCSFSREDVTKAASMAIVEMANVNPTILLIHDELTTLSALIIKNLFDNKEDE